MRPASRKRRPRSSAPGCSYESEIGGVNTTVAAMQAELDQARYYLDNTLMVAPEDGYIINLQVRPGMVAGDIRFGAIASFICDADRYLLANFFQENLKYVKPGQVVEVALDLYPGQIWRGKVEAIWQGSGAGQMLPSGTLPDFKYVPTEIPQGQFAVAITLDDPDQSKFPIGTQGRAAIYTSPTSGFVVLRKSISAPTHGSTGSIRSPADGSFPDLKCLKSQPNCGIISPQMRKDRRVCKEKNA